jgi:antitoxin (DNA-binding transcriptional repressor) of toxin-antitoxin stability system
MTSVNISHLRSRLSTYLGRVRRGEEILIRDRNLAIAKIVPLHKTGDFGQDIEELAAQGLVRLPAKRLDWKAFFALPAPDIPMDNVRSAIEAEREED